MLHGFHSSYSLIIHFSCINFHISKIVELQRLIPIASIVFELIQNEQRFRHCGAKKPVILDEGPCINIAVLGGQEN